MSRWVSTLTPSSVGHDDDLGPADCLLVEQVEDRGEVHRVGDDLRPAAAEVEGAEDDRVGERDIRLEDDLPCPAPISGATRSPRSATSVHQASSQARTPRDGPGLVVRLQALAAAARHGAERVADQVVASAPGSGTGRGRPAGILGAETWRRNVACAYLIGSVRKTARTGLASKPTSLRAGRSARRALGHGGEHEPFEDRHVVAEEGVVRGEVLRVEQVDARRVDPDQPDAASCRWATSRA